ncbi:MAG TPA: 3-dehydroquinate synthase [Tissierellia bacterium]|nr:3-dehydroquinate synthase [Tissierellia bacterium]
MKIKVLNFSTILIQRGLIKNLGSEINTFYNNKKISIITDETVYSLYGKIVKESLKEYNYEVQFIAVKPGERSKSLETLKNVYEKFIEFNLTRGDLIIALGGGVVGDLAGFAASTYLRGVDYVQVPTTLLSQIDSSIGGKVAVNLQQGKNLIGSFYHPKRVFIDPEVLHTLPEKFIKDGLGEVIKYACIKDIDLYNRLYSIKSKEELFSNLEKIIYTCCNIKKEVVEKDERDKGERMLLNFGHTLGHAIEKHFNYKYSHGQAVALGMYHITKKSEAIGYSESGTAEKIKNILINFNIQYKLPNLNMDKIKDIILLDKKNISGKINLILLRKIGQGFIERIPLENIDKFLGEL